MSISYLLSLMVVLYADATDIITTTTESFSDEGKYNMSSLNGVHLEKGGVVELSTGQTSLGHPTTTTGSEDSWFIIKVCGIAYFVCTAPVIGGLFACIIPLRKRRRLRRLYPKYDGVTQVDATVTNKRTVPRQKRTSYYLTYTFTGTHPDHGPFRMTRQDFDINDKRLFDCLKVGGSVHVYYHGVDPENCAPVHYINEMRNKKTTGCVACFSTISLADILYRLGFAWLLGISNLPFYFIYVNLAAGNYSMGALAGILALASLALGVGLGYGVQQIYLHSRRKFVNNNLIIQYEEDIEV